MEMPVVATGGPWGPSESHQGLQAFASSVRDSLEREGGKKEGRGRWWRDHRIAKMKPA